MEFFISKIFSGKKDEFVHLQFQKFSRGKFENKALIKAKNSKGKYSLATTYEYANELVRALAEKLGSNKTKVTGVIISTRKLKEMPEFSRLLENSPVKQFAGVRQYGIDVEMSGNEIISICDKIPNAVISLSFAAGESELKVKTKAPKSSKPSNKSDEKPEPDYCKLKTQDRELVKRLLFDVNLEKFKLTYISHDFLIEHINVDSSIKDPQEMREKAVRKGKIIRTTDVDGIIVKEEKTFEA